VALDSLSPVADEREAARRAHVTKYAYAVASFIVIMALIVILVIDYMIAIVVCGSVLLVMLLSYIIPLLLPSRSAAGELMMYVTTVSMIAVGVILLGVLSPGGLFRRQAKRLADLTGRV
jgi:hypothetical protein